MPTDWIAPFQEQSTAICQELTALRMLPQLNQWETGDLEGLLRLLNAVMHWAQSLPTDEQVWALVNFNGLLFHAINHLLEDMQRILGNMAGTVEMRSAQNKALAERIRALMQQGVELRMRLREVRQTAPKGPDPTSPIISLAPVRMLGVFRIMFFPWQVGAPHPILEQADSRQLLYHPSHTLSLVHGILSALNRNSPRKTQISCAFTPSFFELILSRPTVPLTAQQWDEIRASSPNSLEVLYEMGGALDPLTWDEGQGEGVIVRLPWAGVSYNKTG